MDNRQKELSMYRLQEAGNSLIVAKNCLNDGFFTRIRLIDRIIQHFMQLKLCLH